MEVESSPKLLPTARKKDELSHDGCLLYGVLKS